MPPRRQKKIDILKQNKRPTACAVGRSFILSVIKSVVLLVNQSVEDLNDLNDRDNENSKTECYAVFHKIKMCKLKRLCKERDLDNYSRENERKDSRAPEPPVLLLHSEDRAVERSHVECVADLAKRECKERH